MKNYIRKLSLTLWIALFGATSVLQCDDSGNKVPQEKSWIEQTGDEVSKSYTFVTLQSVGKGVIRAGKVVFYTSATAANIVAIPFRVMGEAPRTTSVGILTAGMYFGVCKLLGQDYFEPPKTKWEKNSSGKATLISAGIIGVTAAGMLGYDYYRSWKYEPTAEKIPENEKNSTSNK